HVHFVQSCIALRSIIALLLSLPPPPSATLFPYTTLFRSGRPRLLGLRPHTAQHLAPERHGRPRGPDRRRLARLRRRRPGVARGADRKSTRLNSSHRTISYAVFCWKKKTASYGISG